MCITIIIIIIIAAVGTLRSGRCINIVEFLNLRQLYDERII